MGIKLGGKENRDVSYPPGLRGNNVDSRVVQKRYAAGQVPSVTL